MFLKNWQDVGLDASVALLEYSKSETVNSERKWRPTNELVENQIRPHVINALNKKKMYFERQINFQNGQLEVIMIVLHSNHSCLTCFTYSKY
jgi:hypothetical protein